VTEDRKRDGIKTARDFLFCSKIPVTQISPPLPDWPAISAFRSVESKRMKLLAVWGPDARCIGRNLSKNIYCDHGSSVITA